METLTYPRGVVPIDGERVSLLHADREAYEDAVREELKLEGETPDGFAIREAHYRVARDLLAEEAARWGACWQLAIASNLMDDLRQRELTPEDREYISSHVTGLEDALVGVLTRLGDARLAEEVEA